MMLMLCLMIAAPSFGADSELMRLRGIFEREEAKAMLPLLKGYSKALKEHDAVTLKALLKDGRERKEKIDGMYKN